LRIVVERRRVGVAVDPWDRVHRPGNPPWRRGFQNVHTDARSLTTPNGRIRHLMRHRRTRGCRAAAPYMPGESRSGQLVTWSRLFVVAVVLGEGQHPACCRGWRRCRTPSPASLVWTLISVTTWRRAAALSRVAHRFRTRCCTIIGREGRSRT